MKLVIDISDEMWQAVQDGWVGNELWHNALANGTPLPKGHGRLIDADRVITEATERMKYSANHQYMECVIAHMKLASTIIEADTESEE